MEQLDGNDEIHNCVIKLRVNPQRRKEKVYVGCGAGFGGDRPMAALKLLQRVEELDYLVLECLAERTLADRYQAMVSGGDGYDSRISEWMHLLLPLAVARGTCIITNMGAIDPPGAQNKVIEIANNLGLRVSVAVAHEVSLTESVSSTEKCCIMDGGISTYLGAAPIVGCLEKYQPNVIITSRVADAALFLAPMVYELGWNWGDLKLIAQGSLAGHLLECGCQLTGGYFMHPGDKHRDMSLPCLLGSSLPYAEITFDGKVCVAKAEGGGGVLNFSTCAEQLLYEVGNPAAYITPDVVIDIRDVSFHSLSSCKVLCTEAKPACGSVPDKLLQLVPKDFQSDSSSPSAPLRKDCGWKGWGEISYGGYECVKRAKAADFLVRSWMEEVCPGVNSCIISYIIGHDSLKAISIDDNRSLERANKDIRLRMDGLFELKEHAVQFTKEFTALYTNGPAGGGGISTGHKKEIILEKKLVDRENIFWKHGVKFSEALKSNNEVNELMDLEEGSMAMHKPVLPLSTQVKMDRSSMEFSSTGVDVSPASCGQKIPLYNVAHSRAGDKGNDSNFSIIPHFPTDVERLKLIITPQWVKEVVSTLLNTYSFPDSETVDEKNRLAYENITVEVYEVRGIHSLNVVVRNILDGGVNCSRRIDRHGKTLSDLILSQQVVLPS